MPAKKIDDDSKVMDVSKPGKGKIITTSRPVVAPIASGNPSTDESASASTPVKEEVKPLAPSATHKVIQPLNSIEVKDASTEENIKIVPTTTENKEEPEAPIAQEEAKTEQPAAEQPAAEESAVKEEVPPADKPAPAAENEKTSEQTASADEPESKPLSSDAAGVDAVVGAAEAKKLAAKEAEEQAKRDAALQELIQSKKYFVPIGHETQQAKSGHRHHEWLMVFIIVLLAGLIAGYLLVDAGVVSTSFELPVDLIKG